MEMQYFGAWDNFLFNHAEVSNRHIDALVNGKTTANIPDSIVAELLVLHVQNDIRLFHYRSADSICNLLLTRYTNLLGTQAAADVHNSAQITSALKNVAPQTLARNGKVDVEFKRDLVGLIRIPVTINGKQEDFIMDTGANLSATSESEAARLGIQLLDAGFDVVSSSRSAVNAKLGLAPKLQIGNAVFTNVVFIVLPDKALKFAGGIYKIRGIIGLPVIAQLGEIQISDKHVISPETQTADTLQNFGLVGNTPFIEASFFGQPHAYIFDTGAASSLFAGKFQSVFRDSLANAHSAESRVGGAGGVQKMDILRAKNVHYSVSGSQNVLKYVSIQLSGNEGIFSDFYGILGQDVLTQWKNVTINFDRMYVRMSDPVKKD